MRDTWITTARNRHYEVNEDGYVRNSRNNRILTNSPNNKGYMTVSLGKRMPGQLVHVLVAEAFVPGYEPGLDVDHKNGKKWDNRAENLEWCTRSENIKRAFEMGLAKGHKGPNSGLSPRKVRIVETGEVFDSQAECARSIKGSICRVSLCARDQNKTHKGYHFERID